MKTHALLVLIALIAPPTSVAGQPAPTLKTDACVSSSVLLPR